jgi:radical SAM-linked protein
MTLRFRFVKLGRVRWTSHRDVARMWERALRRARVPLAFTEGFSPRPKLSFGLALPTGCESLAEYLDVSVSQPVEADDVLTRLGPLLPDGVTPTAAAPVPEGAPSLQQAVTSCSWEIDVPASEPEVRGAVERVLGATTLPLQRERKGRLDTDDVRPAVLALSTAIPAPGAVTLVAELAAQGRGVRPAELGRVMALEFGAARRTTQWIERDGSRTEPLVADAAWAAAAR